MNALLKVFDLLESRGYRFCPVFGTQWYKVHAPDGHHTLIKESTLKSLWYKGEGTNLEHYLASRCPSD